MHTLRSVAIAGLLLAPCTLAPAFAQPVGQASSRPPSERPWPQPEPISRPRPSTETATQPADPAPRVEPEPIPQQDRKAAGEADEDPRKKRRSVAEDTIVRLRGSGWFTSLSGNVSSGVAFPGTVSDIDLIDDLNLDPDQAVFLGGLGISFNKKLHLDAGYAGPFSFDGTSDPIDISFNDLVFSGTLVSEADFDVYHAELAYDVVEAGPLTIALGFGIRVMDFSATVTGTATDPGSGTTAQMTESVDAIIPLPAPGITVRLDLTKRLYTRGVLRGVYVGDYGNFFDAVGEVGFDFTRNVGIFAGYRWMHGEADVSDVAFEVDLDGFYAGVEVRF